MKTFNSTNMSGLLGTLVRAAALQAVAVLLLLLVSCRTAESTPVPLSSPTMANWLKSIPDTKLVSEISIPGTHDSCATLETFPHTSRCQSLSISEQLNVGVRFLDVRCRRVRNSFEIYHGWDDQKISFDQVLAVCYAFLEAHRSEFILMSVKEEDDPIQSSQSFEQIFDAEVGQRQEIWSLGDTIPTLGQARGRVILFRRFSDSEVPKGIAAGPSQWRDDATFDIDNTIKVQDEYVVKDTNAKWQAIRDQFARAQAGDPRVLFLNFTSGFRPGLLGIPDINAVSNDINPRLISYLKKAKTGRFGITIMDFADADKAAAVIATNRAGDGKELGE